MNKNFYSPTMLTKYINCKHIISNEHNEEKLKIQRKERTITDELRIEKGLDHEASYFEELKKKYSKVKNIKSLKSLSKKEKIKETIKSLKFFRLFVQGTGPSVWRYGPDPWDPLSSMNSPFQEPGVPVT